MHKEASKRWVCAALIALFLSPNANAASIFIDADNIDDRVAFNFGQFEAGFSINGSTPVTTGGSIFGDGTQLNFTGQWIDLGAATAFSRTVYWSNPGAPTAIEQIFQWTITPSGASGLATISGFFQSRGLGTIPINVNPADVITTTTDGSHNPFSFSAAFLGGQILADRCGEGAANAPACPVTVPEPATLGLLGAGLLALGLMRRRRAA